MDVNEKNFLREELYHGRYKELLTKDTTKQEQKPTKSERNNEACSMTITFVSLIDNYVANKDKATLDSINKAAKGRYTFIIRAVLKIN